MEEDYYINLVSCTCAVHTVGIEKLNIKLCARVTHLDPFFFTWGNICYEQVKWTLMTVTKSSHIFFTGTQHEEGHG